MRCPQVFVLITVYTLLFVSILLTAGPQVLETILRSHPVGHAFIIGTQFAIVLGLCYSQAPIANWFATMMFSTVTVLTYSLASFVTAKADHIRPLVKESMECVKKAKTPEQRQQCVARAKEHLRAALNIKVRPPAPQTTATPP